MIKLINYFKGILLQDTSDRSKELAVEIDPTATTGTRTTLKAGQTADRTVTLPDATDILVGKVTTDILENKTIGDSADNTKQLDFSLSGATTSTKTTVAASQTVNRTVTLPDSDDTLMGRATTDTVTNKSIDADNNTITNIDNADIKVGAAIDATKIHDGSVDNTEFGHLNGVTSAIQTQIDAKVDSYGAGTQNTVLRSDTTGDIVKRSSVTIDDTGNMIVPGDLTVNGTTVTVNATNLDIEDKNININYNGSDATSEGAGITVERTSTDGSLVYQDALVSKFKIGALGSEVEIADVSSSQVIQNKDIDGGTASNTSRLTLPQDTKTNLDGLTRKEGTVVYANDEDTVYYDDGTNLVPVGSGNSSSNGINYVKNPTGDIDASDYNTYDDGAVTAPVNGDGGVAGGIAVDRTTDSVEVLRGDGSIRINKSAVNAQGEGVRVNLDPIDPFDIEKRLQVSFDYKQSSPLSNNYANGDLRVFIYDVDNTTLIGAVENDDNGDILRHEGEGAKFIGFFNATDSLNYRLLIHQTSTAATTARTIVDNVQLGPVGFVPASAQNAIDTNFLTANVTSNGTITDLTFSDLEIGATYELDAQFYVAIDVGVSDVAVEVFAVHDGNNMARSTWQMQETTDSFTDNVTLAMNRKFTATATTITFNAVSCSASSFIIGNSTAEGSYAQLEKRNDLETNVVSNTKLNQQAIRVAGAGNGGTSVTANVTNIDFTETVDKLNLWNGTQFTAHKTGMYSVSGSIARTAAATGTINAYVDGVTRKAIGNATGNTTGVIPFAGDIFLNKGEVLSLRTDVSATLANSTITHHIEILSKPDFTNYGVINPNTQAIESNVALTNYSISASTWGDLTSIDLTPGEWDLDAFVNIFNNGAITSGNIQIGISTTSGASGAGLIVADNSSVQILPATSGWWTIVSNPTYTVTVTSNTTFYLKANKSGATTNIQHASKLRARKVK